MNNHDRYREISTLVAMGEIDVVGEPDLADWRTHWRTCMECQELAIDAREILLALYTFPETNSSLPPQAVSSMIKRAEKEGARFSGRERQSTTSKAILVWSVAATAAFCAILAFNLSERRLSRVSGLASQTRTEDSQMPGIGVPNANPTAVSNIQSLEIEVLHAREREESLAHSVALKQKALDDLQEEEVRLRSRILDLEHSNGEAATTIETLRSERAAAVLTHTSELEQLRKQLAATEGIVKSTQANLTEATNKAAALAEELNRERQNISVLKELQELLKAPHVHLIVIPPMEPAPPGPRRFGQILYAEGKGALFYAFNLADSSSPGSTSFHVWGQGSGHSIKSLGVFERDQASGDVWSMSITDADAFSQVDRIFVTAEAGTVALNHPTGKPILITTVSER